LNQALKEELITSKRYTSNSTLNEFTSIKYGSKIIFSKFQNLIKYIVYSHLQPEGQRLITISSDTPLTKIEKIIDIMEGT